LEYQEFHGTVMYLKLFFLFHLIRSTSCGFSKIDDTKVMVFFKW